MSIIKLTWITLFSFTISSSISFAQTFENPITTDWISENLQSTSPRLILTTDIEKVLKAKIQTNESTQLAYRLLLHEADDLLNEPPLERKQIGRRLLSVSRETVRRLSTLSLAHRLTEKAVYLDRLEQELIAVSSFGDWNPSHFLDVAEMSFAVAIALDWSKEVLSPTTKNLVEQALITKGLKPAIAASNYNWWIDAHHNWNLVCHGGMAIAALSVYEKEPEMASYILRRAVEKIPLGLTPYAPDGIYPEGPSYWFYATQYLTATIAAFETSLNTDFGFTKASGFLESVQVSTITAGATDRYYNFFDGSQNGYHALSHFGLLAWFAQRKAISFDEVAYEAQLKTAAIDEDAKNRFMAFNLIYVAQVNEQQLGKVKRPIAWSGQGTSPIVVFRTDETEKSLFLAAKGGRAADNHGNMDVGSFIFELDGVRWSIDPGNQSYNDLEKLMGGELWNNTQNSRRWTLLTKNNYGHSTLTVNGQPHLVDARSTLVSSSLNDKQASVIFDLAPAFGDLIQQAERTFRQLNSHTVVISDQLTFSPKTETITWQMMTQAKVEINEKGARLLQDDQVLQLEVLQPEKYDIKVVSLSPPPLAYDKNIPDLKRIEIQVSRAYFKGKTGVIRVQLSR